MKYTVDADPAVGIVGCGSPPDCTITVPDGDVGVALGPGVAEGPGPGVADGPSVGVAEGCCATVGVTLLLQVFSPLAEPLTPHSFTALTEHW